MKKKFVLVANTKKTAIRVAEIDGPRLLKPSDEARRGFFEKNFPLGEKMNEETHVFDGAVFTNKNGQSQFFMAALPVDICDKLARESVEKAGSIHRIARLECAEHILFRKYCEAEETNESTLVFLPQDDGLRVLYIKDNLPEAVIFISNNPAHRRDEFFRFYDSLEKSASQRAVLLNFSEKFCWLREILTKQNVSCEEAEYTEQEDK